MRLCKSLVNILTAGLILVLFFMLSPGILQGNPAVLTLNIGGDVFLDRGVKSLIDMAGLGGVMSGVTPLFSSGDYTLINLECPVTDIVAPAIKSYVFRADPALLKAMRSIGITHAGLANNHTLDQGETGFIDTIQNLAKAGIAAVGVAKVKAGEASPEIIEKNGLKVAVFAMNMVEITVLDKASKEAGPCDASTENMSASVKSFHREYPGIHAVVFLHWGEEYSLFPTEDQVNLAHSLIDAGADAVVGCHPHVVQGIEVYHGRPIAYSLGNLLFDQTLPETQRGLVVTLSFGQDSITGITIHRIWQMMGTPHIEGELKLDLNSDKVMLPSALFP